jgi:hypothetical protein
VSSLATDVGVATADPIMSAIRGAQAAQTVIETVQLGCAAPDALNGALAVVVAADDPELLRSFARRLQKALEAHR